MEQSSIRVREYQEADRAIAADLFEEGMLEYAGPDASPRVAAAFHIYTPKEKESFFSDVPGNLCKRNGGCMFVAVDKADQVVGTIAVKVSDEDVAKDSAELMRMSVRRAMRRKGVGKLLLAHVIAYVRDVLKKRVLWLGTLESMRMAVNFYLANGFTIVPGYRKTESVFKPGEADSIRFHLMLRD